MEIIFLIFLIMGAIISLTRKRGVFVYSYFLIISIVFVGLNNHHLQIGNNNYINEDFYNYYTLFNSNLETLKLRSSDIGFYYLILLFNRFNMTFVSFRIFLSIVSFNLLYFSIRKHSQNISLIFLLYLIFPFTNDIIQIRNYLSYSIIIFGITHFVLSDKPKYILFLLTVILGSAFHYSNIIFLLLPLFVKNSYKNVLKVSVFILFPLMVFMIYSNILGTVVTSVFNSPKILKYFSETRGMGLILIYGTLLMIFISSFFLLTSILSRTENKFERTFVEKIILINLFMLVMGSMWAYNFNFIRWYRNIFILNYIVLVKYKITYKIKINLETVVFLVSILVLTFTFYIRHYDSQIIPVFRDNFVLDYLKNLI